MRGGTSKGAFFVADDLPADPAERDDVILRIVGSPDPRQIDGIGGAHPLTTKVAVVSRSDRPGIDLDYLFLQPSVDQALLSDAQNCGNMLAAVGPFGLERGLIGPAPEGAHDVSTRIFMVNTASIVTARFPLGRDGRPDYAGDTSIDGVPGSVSRCNGTLTSMPCAKWPTEGTNSGRRVSPLYFCNSATCLCSRPSA